MRVRAVVAVGVFLVPLVMAAYARAQEPSPVSPEGGASAPDSTAPDPQAADDAGAPPSTAPSPPVIPPALQPTPVPIDDTEPPLSILPPSAEDKFVDPRMARSWKQLPARAFVSTMVDIGFVYMRPRVSAGYGKPFTSWIGVDANPTVATQGFGLYGGLRLELPFVDFRIGPRYFFAFNRTYLADQESYHRLALETSAGAPSRVITYETELDASLPVGPGNILARASLSYVSNVPDGQNVFEETLRVIVRPPWVWRTRGGYALRLGAYSQHSIGVVADVLGVPNRGSDAITVRVGPVLRIVLSRRVDVRGSFVATILSPDRIGLPGGDFTELGVRYRWATE